MCSGNVNIVEGAESPKGPLIFVFSVELNRV